MYTLIYIILPWKGRLRNYRNNKKRGIVTLKEYKWNHMLDNEFNVTSWKTIKYVFLNTKRVKFVSIFSRFYPRATRLVVKLLYSLRFYN